MSDILKAGSKGEPVKALQTKLNKLGFSNHVNGTFGPETKQAVEELQLIFGYDADGLVGPATLKLIDTQLGYAWLLSADNAIKRGLEAQGKKTDKGDLAGADLTRTLRPGLDGADVRYLQRRLKALGFDVGVDGKFGPATGDAVRKLQAAFGYDVDASVGPATHKLINQQLGYGWNVNKAAAANA
jgi:peptidoglycan hydrolase-like protein with peptidoglycan-binding domain